MKINKPTARLIPAAIIMLAMALAPGFAAAQSDYEEGYEAGQQAAQERLAQEQSGAALLTGHTGPLGLLVSYLGEPRTAARSCCDLSRSEGYQRGFIDGYCHTVKAEQRSCFKGFSGPHHVNVVGRLP